MTPPRLQPGPGTSQSHFWSRSRRGAAPRFSTKRDTRRHGMWPMSNDGAARLRRKCTLSGGMREIEQGTTLSPGEGTATDVQSV